MPDPIPVELEIELLLPKLQRLYGMAVVFLIANQKPGPLIIGVPSPFATLWFGMLSANMKPATANSSVPTGACAFIAAGEVRTPIKATTAARMSLHHRPVPLSFQSTR